MKPQSPKSSEGRPEHLLPITITAKIDHNKKDEVENNLYRKFKQ
jgi:hypothetical protein